MAQTTNAKEKETDDGNKLAALRGRFQQRLYTAEEKLVSAAMKKADGSIRRAAALLGSPPSSLQSCIESNPMLRRLYGSESKS